MCELTGSLLDCESEEHLLREWLIAVRDVPSSSWFPYAHH
jgi:hypothetical protein